MGNLKMKTFVVYSDISHLKEDAATWVAAIPKMLRDAKVAEVKYKTAYCCTLDGKLIAEFEGPDKDNVKQALTKISLPFTAVMEATKL
jgi:hypothetical protein